MLIKDETNSMVITVIDRIILWGIFLFALSTLVSKGASSVGVGLASLFWLIRIVITKNYDFNKTKLDSAVLFFIGALLFSGLDVISIKFLDEVDNILLAILFYYTIINTIDDLKLVKKLSYLVFVSMLVSLFYGLYQKFNLGMRRIEGFSFSLSYGGLLSIFLLFTVIYLLWGKIDWKRRASLFLVSIMSGINLLFTLARGAWLGFLGACFSIFLIKKKRLIAALLIFLLVLGIFLPKIFVKRFKSIVEFETDRSIKTRINLWKGSWAMFKDYPINGVGFGYFTDEFNENYRFDRLIANASHAHNNFLHFLAVAGLFGFLSLSYLTLKILNILYTAYQSINKRYWKLFILASFGGMISFTIQGLTEYSFGDTEQLRFFWFLLALSMVVINNIKSRDI